MGERREEPLLDQVKTGKMLFWKLYFLKTYLKEYVSICELSPPVK